MRVCRNMSALLGPEVSWSFRICDWYRDTDLGGRRYAGVAPNASTETCDISDFMHSNTWLLRQTGNATYGDRLERAFHNAAPAAVSRSYMQHVYYQSANLKVSAKSSNLLQYRLHVQLGIESMFGSQPHGS